MRVLHWNLGIVEEMEDRSHLGGWLLARKLENMGNFL